MNPETKARLRELFAKGSLFEGKFRIEGHLGTGSFAYVLLARHEAMERRVALKVLKPDLVSANPSLVKRFVNEVKIVAKLTHPNTVTVYDFGRTADGIHYLVMEYVEGVSLDEVIDEQGALSPHRAVAVTRQILKSLAEAHSHGIVHRDLKPSNIMLTYTHDEQEVVKVLDFGVAKLVEQRRPSEGFERRSTQFVGTPVYMSPEQVLGQDVDPASDLYSLGLILYEMLTGEPPFRDTSVALIAQAHIDDAPLPLARLDELTGRFQNLIRRATSRTTADRFRDVGSFARALPTIGETEYSAEFSRLLTGEVDPVRPADASADDSDGWEAFSGRNYIEAPSESEAEAAPPAPRNEPKPAQPVRLNWADEDARRRPASGVVELDVGQVRRDELRRQRDRSGDQHVVVIERDWRGYAWVAAGLVAVKVSFLIASTVWVDGDGPDRWLLGFLPVGIAVLWATFAGVRRHRGDLFDRTIVPLARHMVFTAAALVLIVCVLTPEAGASRLAEAGTWFLGDIPEHSPLRILRTVTRGIANLLAALFSFSSKVIPW